MDKPWKHYTKWKKLDIKLYSRVIVFFPPIMYLQGKKKVVSLINAAEKKFILLNLDPLVYIFFFFFEIQIHLHGENNF